MRLRFSLVVSLGSLSLWLAACGGGSSDAGSGGGPAGGSSTAVGGSLAAGGASGGSGNGGPGTGGSVVGGAGSGGQPAAGGSAVGGDAAGVGGAAAGGGPTGGAAPGSGGGGPGDFVTATDLVASLKLGWNLGNSLDAPEGETAWGNPTVTAALFTAVKQAGFSAVRIPVTWSLHMGPGPSFTIEPSFLARVAEVVGYAKAAGLPAIINLHHDGADNLAGVEWLTLTDSSGAVSTQNNSAVEARFVAVWTQVAGYFKDHDGTLLFESMNEIHDGYDAPKVEYYGIINHLNQVFVDLIRESGGNNAQRCLVVPGYNTNIDYTVAGFELPEDSVDDRLILSVHFYDPWSYAGEGSTHTWGNASPGKDSWGQEDYMVTQYDKLVTRFVSQGLPMIVGEYGAVHQSGYEDYRRYYMEYVTKVIVDRGIVPFYWDNGSTGSGADGFGLIARNDGSAIHPAITAAMVKAATTNYSLSQVPLPTP